MTTARFALGPLLLAAFACESAPPDRSLPADAEGFRPLFNGKDLEGWVNVNCAPGTWTWRDGLLVCNGRPTGVLRTERIYEDFVLELEWRHMHPGGNAGIFVMSDALPAVGVPFTRSVEVQVLDGTETADYTSHGDVFSIHGARLRPDRPHPAGWERCLPSERRAKASPQWNHYAITCRDGTLKLAVNGAEVSGASELAPSRGYICLESEGSEVHFKNVRIRELSKSRAAPEVDRGWAGLYTGVDLGGWKQPVGADAAHWTVRDWTIVCDSPAEALWTEQELGDGEVRLDVRAVEGSPTAILRLRGEGGFEVAVQCKPEGAWSRVHVLARGDDVDIDVDGQKSAGELPGVKPAGAIGLSGEGLGRIEIANLFVRRSD